MANPFDTADFPRSGDDIHPQMVPPDPFPPLTTSALDLAPAAVGHDLNWSRDDELRREMARLEAGYPAGPGAAANGFSKGSFANGHSDALSAALARLPLAAGYSSGTTDVAGLRAENEEMHKLIEEMKLIFEQAAAQEEASSKALAEARSRATDLERLMQERVDQVEMLTGQITELEKHIQETPAAPPPPPTEDELSKLADELEKERCSMAQERKSLDQDRRQLRDDEETLMKQMREMEVQMARERGTRPPADRPSTPSCRSSPGAGTDAAGGRGPSGPVGPVPAAAPGRIRTHQRRRRATSAGPGRAAGGRPSAADGGLMREALWPVASDAADSRPPPHVCALPANPDPRKVPCARSANAALRARGL